MSLLLVLRRVTANHCIRCLSLDIPGYSHVSSRSFKCSLVYAKRSFYAAENGLFGKLLNLASEEVIFELVIGPNVPQFYYTS